MPALKTFPCSIFFLDIGFFFLPIVCQYLPYFFAFFISADEDDPINIGVKLMLLSRYGTVTHKRGRAYPINKHAGRLILRYILLLILILFYNKIQTKKFEKKR